MFVNWIIDMIFKAPLRLGCIANLSVNYFSELKIQRELAVTRPSICTTANERVYISARAARIAGALRFALTAFVVFASTLKVLGYRGSKPSPLGIRVLVAAALVMPWLASRKRQLAVVTSNAALKADAAESALCGYMA